MKTHGRHWRRRLVGLLFPSGKVALPLAAFCAAALAWIFGCGLDGTSAAYAVYASRSTRWWLSPGGRSALGGGDGSGCPPCLW